MADRKYKDKKRYHHADNEKFNKEIRSFFKQGGTLTKGIPRPISDPPQVGSKVHHESVDPGKSDCKCPKIELAVFLAKVVDKFTVDKFIEFDTGIGNDNIMVGDTRDQFLFGLPGLYQFDILIRTNTPHGKLVIVRDPAFDDSLNPFFTFDLSQGLDIKTILPVHAGESIKINLAGHTILAGSQIQLTRVGDI
jgi:hypothetical protein